MQHQMTFDEIDRKRMDTLGDAVAECMADRAWRTLGEICDAIKRGSEAGVSARLRELRRFRGLNYEKRRRGGGRSGLYEYRYL